MATIYARIKAQFLFIYHTLFSAGFYKISKEGQRIDEVDFFVNLNINQIVTESGNKNIDIKSQLEQKIQSRGTKVKGLIFDKNYFKENNFFNW